MNVLPKDVLWLILDKVIVDRLTHDVCLLFETTSTRLCANCNTPEWEWGRQFVCNCWECISLCKKGYNIQTHCCNITQKYDWACGCFRAKDHKFYCLLHKYTFLVGPLGKYTVSEEPNFDPKFEQFIINLSSVNSTFRRLLQSKRVWLDKTKNIWRFNDNVLTLKIPIPYIECHLLHKFKIYRQKNK